MRFPADRQKKRKVLLDAVASVRETVSACADESERLGTLAPAAVDAIRDAGLFTLKLPMPLGGAEADPVTQCEIIEELAYIDAAAGWCLMIGATAIGRPGAFLPDEAIAEMFPNGRIPTAATATSISGEAIPVDRRLHPHRQVALRKRSATRRVDGSGRESSRKGEHRRD